MPSQTQTATVLAPIAPGFRRTAIFARISVGASFPSTIERKSGVLVAEPNESPGLAQPRLAATVRWVVDRRRTGPSQPPSLGERHRRAQVSTRLITNRSALVNEPERRRFAVRSPGH